MDELRPCSLTSQNFYDSTTIFLPLPPGASLTGMLASRPMGLGVPPPVTTMIVDACTPLAFVVEGDSTLAKIAIHPFGVGKLVPSTINLLGEGIYSDLCSVRSGEIGG